MKEMILQTEKGNVLYWISEKWIDGSDTIFFLPGLTADHTMFDRQVAFFGEKCNVLTWDAPAHGKSRPFQTVDYDDTSDYIKMILDRHAADKAVLVGQSLGGMLAQAFIKRYPDRAKGFVSLDSVPYGSRYYSKFELWMVKQVGWMDHLYPLRWMKRAMAKQVSATQRSYNNIIQALAPYGKNELCHLMGQYYAAFPKDNCELEIPCPVLLVLGENDKTGRVAQYSRAWAKQTGYPLKVISGASHNVNLDKPEEVNACIDEFLMSI